MKDLSAFGAELGEILEGLRSDEDVLEGAEVKDGVVLGKLSGQGLVHINDMVGAFVRGSCRMIQRCWRAN